MSDTEKEAFRQIGIDLINEYRQQRGLMPIQYMEINTPEVSAFIRSIQLHEKTKQELADCKQELSAFRQEVSDAVVSYFQPYDSPIGFQRFIIPLPKPDPLVEVLLDMELSSDQEEGQHDAKWLRLKLEARGFEIREKGQ